METDTTWHKLAAAKRMLNMYKHVEEKDKDKDEANDKDVVHVVPTDLRCFSHQRPAPVLPRCCPGAAPVLRCDSRTVVNSSQCFVISSWCSHHLKDLSWPFSAFTQAKCLRLGLLRTLRMSMCRTKRWTPVTSTTQERELIFYIF